MVLIPLLSELVYHMLQVAAIVGKPSQQFVDQERCDVPKWTENPKMRFETFSATLQLVGFWQLYNCWGYFEDTYQNSEFIHVIHEDIIRIMVEYHLSASCIH